MLVAFNRGGEEVTLAMNFPHRNANPIFVSKGELADVQVEDSEEALFR